MKTVTEIKRTTWAEAYGKTVTLLRHLGVRLPAKVRGKRKGGHFWEHDGLNYMELLEQARSCYRRRMKEVHPDKLGTTVHAQAVNLAWSNVRRRFAAHGFTLGVVLCSLSFSAGWIPTTRAAETQVTLAWDMPPDRNTAGVNLYYGRENFSRTNAAGLPPAQFTGGWTNRLQLGCVTNATLLLDSGVDYLIYVRTFEVWRGREIEALRTPDAELHFTPARQVQLLVTATLEGRGSESTWSTVTNVTLPAFEPRGTNQFYRVRARIEEL